MCAIVYVFEVIKSACKQYRAEQFQSRTLPDTILNLIKNGIVCK